MRLVTDQSGAIRRAQNVNFTFDGLPLQAPAGETLAAALFGAGVRHLRDAPEGGGPRGAFCLMGLCQECLVEIDGRRVESCRVAVSEGLAVTSLRVRHD